MPLNALLERLPGGANAVKNVGAVGLVGGQAALIAALIQDIAELRRRIDLMPAPAQIHTLAQADADMLARIEERDVETQRINSIMQQNQVTIAELRAEVMSWARQLSSEVTSLRREIDAYNIRGGDSRGGP